MSQLSQPNRNVWWQKQQNECVVNLNTGVKRATAARGATQAQPRGEVGLR